MVVGRMMLDLEKNDAAFRTVWSKTVLRKRTVHLLKPRGPLSTVGRLDDAMEAILSKHKIDAIIMVDAALKMEGEESATITRGFGAAIGGIGTERFRIEETATKYGIPIHAIVVKQSIKQAVTLMTKDIALTADAVRDHVLEMTSEVAPEGGAVLVAGVGNTMGCRSNVQKERGCRTVHGCKVRIVRKRDKVRVLKGRLSFQEDEMFVRVRNAHRNDIRRGR